MADVSRYSPVESDLIHNSNQSHLDYAIIERQTQFGIICLYPNFVVSHLRASALATALFQIPPMDTPRCRKLSLRNPFLVTYFDQRASTPSKRTVQANPWLLIF